MRLAALLLAMIVLQPQTIIYPPEAPPRLEPSRAIYAMFGLAYPDPVADPTGVIDLLTIYSNGVNATTCQAGVTETNGVLTASQVTTTSVRLVGCQFIDYTAVNANADFDFITSGAGHAQAEAWRTQFGADDVRFLTPSGDFCGLGWQQATLATAYHWVSSGCCVGNHSCAHELGHNLGLAHDIANQTNPNYAYGQGWGDGTGTYRTIMAYPSPLGGTRLGLLSSPTYTFPNGRPAGDAAVGDNRRVWIARGPVIAALVASVPSTFTNHPR